MILGGQTEARAQLSSTIIDYHEPFDKALGKSKRLLIYFSKRLWRKPSHIMCQIFRAEQSSLSQEHLVLSGRKNYPSSSCQEANNIQIK